MKCAQIVQMLSGSQRPKRHDKSWQMPRKNNIKWQESKPFRHWCDLLVAHMEGLSMWDSRTMSHLWRGPSSAFWRSSLSTGTARLYPPMTSWIYRHRPLFVPSICPHRSNLELDNHSLLSYKDHTCMRLYSQQLIMQNATMAQTLVSSRTALFRTRACVHWHKPNHHRTN